jgi:hypothetical protein
LIALRHCFPPREIEASGRAKAGATYDHQNGYDTSARAEWGMSIKISGTYTTSVLINYAGFSPVTLTGRISLSSGGSTAIAFYGNGGSSYHWTVVNQGVMDANYYGAEGLRLGSSAKTIAGADIVNSGSIYGGHYAPAIKIYTGGTVALTNDSQGKISGGPNGVVTYGYGSFVNYGYIRSSKNFGVRAGLGDLINHSGGTIYGVKSVFFIGNGVVTNDSGGLIKGSYGGSGGYGILLGTATITNAGSVVGGHAILAGGGTIHNQSGGLILGDYRGISFTGNGTVTNDYGATINATYSGEPPFNAGGYGVAAVTATIFNGGLLEGFGTGISLKSGGYVSNASTGTIAVTTFRGSPGAVEFGGSNSTPSTLNDSGTIYGSVSFGGSSSSNLFFYHPGAVFSHGISATSTAFSVSGGHGKLELAAGTAAATLSGLGRTFTNFGTVQVDSGAYWDFTSSNTFATGQVVNNEGTIDGVVTLEGTGALTNALGAVIQGVGGSGFGPIQATGGTVQVVNSGSIAGTGGAFAMSLAAGGSLTNTTSGVITGYGIRGNGAAGTVVNSGFISGSGGIGADGVVLFAGGLVSNAVAVDLGASGTVSDAGTIVGDSGIAVTFAGASNLLDLTPGYALRGDAVGSGLGTATNQLELASGATTGTLTSFSSKFQRFTDISVASDASWVLTGTDEFADTVTLAGGVTLLSSAQITASSGSAIVGPSGGSPNALTNTGVVTATGTNGDGVAFYAGGYISNGGFGLIQGSNGIGVAGAAGAVNNGGTVIGTSRQGIGLAKGGSIDNAGRITGASGIYVSGGIGTVSNSDMIDGTTGIGVQLSYGGTLTDTGTIIGGAGTAVLFGGFANRLDLTPGYSISGNVLGSPSVAAANQLELSSGTMQGTLSGLGTKFLDFDGIITDAGASWVLANAGSVAGGATLSGGAYLASSGTLTTATGAAIFGTASANTFVNSGIALATGSGNGVAFYAGGRITNTASALIEGYNGIGFAGSAGTVSNAGTIIGTNRQGAGFGVGGSLGNSGQVTGAIGVYISGGLGTVTNSGTISGTAGVGVGLYAGGTIIDTGTITGAGTAIRFGGAGNNLVDVTPGYVISGKVAGSGTVGATNRLELSSGTGQGTVTSFHSKFQYFSGIGIDTGANWLLASAGLVSGGVTLSGAYLAATGGLTATTGAALLGTSGASTLVNSGTVKASGLRSYAVSFQAGGSVSNNAGLIEANYGVLIGGAIGGTVTNSGTILGTRAVGVLLAKGGFINNATQGLIQGYLQGAEIGAVTGSITNAGTIDGVLSYGVLLTKGGGVTNNGGLIEGFRAIDITGRATGTVANSGTITSPGSAGYSVYLGDGGGVTNSQGGYIGSGGVQISNAAGNCRQPRPHRRNLCRRHAGQRRHCHRRGQHHRQQYVRLRRDRVVWHRQQLRGAGERLSDHRRDSGQHSGRCDQYAGTCRQHRLRGVGALQHAWHYPLPGRAVRLRQERDARGRQYQWHAGRCRLGLYPEQRRG